MSRRPDPVPAFWRVIDDRGPGFFGRALPGPGTRRMELWRLALEARDLPYLLTGHGGQQRLFVPPMVEGPARTELAAMTAEGQPTVRRALPRRHNAHWVLFCLLFLVLWHGLRMGWWPLPVEHMPDPDYWLEFGKMDVYRLRQQGEWWRAATALTLHADSLHLFSNLLFGSVFLVLLARRIGLGIALALTVLAGMGGNMLTALYRPMGHTSIGFSTALFGIIGLLCADIAVRDHEGGQGFRRRVLAPLAAGLALLAMLGSEGERTDYAAHIFGLAAGFGLGLCASGLLRHFDPPHRLWEWLIGLAVPFFLFWCWDLAFR